jgi:hypothetical protein
MEPGFTQSKRSHRIRGSGSFARLIVAPIWAIGALTTAPNLAEHHGWIPEALAFTNLSAWLILLMSFALFLRSLFWGVTVNERVVTARSWVRTFRFQTSGLTGCTSVPYSGLINWADSDGSGRWLKMLSFEGEWKRGPRVARGTISLRRSSQRQAAALNELLQAPQVKGS